MIGLLTESLLGQFARHDQLVSRLDAALATGSFRYHPAFSGREAIYALASYWKKQGIRPVAHIPGYICNVVNAALEAAGFAVETYAVDDALEPVPGALDAVLAAGKGGIMLTASVYGSSASLDWLAREDVRTRLIESGFAVIADICQDISLTHALPAGYGDRLAGVVSFNDKSVFGVMGGGVLWEHDTPPSPLEPLALMPMTKLYLRLGMKLAHQAVSFVLPLGKPVDSTQAGRSGALALIMATRQRRPFEYSYCSSFPNDIALRRPARIQLALALAGTKRLPAYAARKHARLAAGGYMNMARGAASPYLIAAPSKRTQILATRLTLRQKLAYGVHGQPDKSLRPDLIVLHNKGFADR